VLQRKEQGRGKHDRSSRLGSHWQKAPSLDNVAAAHEVSDATTSSNTKEVSRPRGGWASLTAGRPVSQGFNPFGARWIFQPGSEPPTPASLPLLPSYSSCVGVKD